MRDEAIFDKMIVRREGFDTRTVHMYTVHVITDLRFILSIASDTEPWGGRGGEKVQINRMV